jgi:hypothetical protein
VITLGNHTWTRYELQPYLDQRKRILRPANFAPQCPGQGFGVYETIAKHAGAGTLVPITGFANSVVAPALEFKTEGFITGTAVKMFSIAGPVIVFGISASVIYGLILCLIG